MTNTTATVGQNDLYTFNGSVGQTLSVALWSSLYSCPNPMVADVYGPGLQYLLTVTAGCESSLYGGGGAASLTLTNSGTFTIIVHDAGSLHTSTYSLSLQSVTGGGCGAKTIVCGQTVLTNTTASSQMDAYSYAGSAGQQLSISLWSALYNYPMTLDVYNPSGILVTNFTANSYSSTYGDGAAVNLTLTTNGTYTILAHSSGYLRNSSYSITLQSVTGGGCNSQPIACGQTVFTNTSFNSEMDAYNYAGSAGQVLSISLWSALYNFPMTLEIYGPTGQLVTNFTANNYSSTYGDGAAVTLPLASTGIYTLLAHNNGFLRTSSYSLSLQSVTGGGCSAQPIACGQSSTNRTTSNSQMDAYSYSGTAGQVLSISLWSSLLNFPVALDIYDPTGLWLTNLTANNYSSTFGDGGALNLPLNTTGTYTILAHQSGFLRSSTYGLSLQSVTGGGCNSQPIACGQAVATNTTFNTEMDAYGFGTGGGPTLFSFSGYSSAQFDLYDSFGNQVFTATPGSSPSTNLATGTYTLLVHDSGYLHSGSYGFSVICAGCNYTISPTSVSVGASATNGSVSVAVGTGCPWTATTNASWLRLTSGSSGSGNGTVNYTVDANCTASERVGTMTIGGTNGWTFTVRQASPVTFAGHDIGSPGAPGSLGFSNCGTFSVSGSGEGTDGSADVFYFTSQILTGDAQIVARLQSLQGGDPLLAEAGVMIRESLDPGSKQASFSINRGTNVLFRRRLAANDLSVETSFRGTNYLQGTNYVWLRLMRMGNTFVAHYSTNGLDWQYMWFTTMTMSNQVQVGLAVTAHHYGQLATATFDNVVTGGLTPLSGVWPFPAPKLLLGGQNWSPAERQRVGGFEFLVAGTVGDYFNIKDSTNVSTAISSWPVLTSVTNQYGVVPVLDPLAVTNSLKFYRAQRSGP